MASDMRIVKVSNKDVRYRVKWKYRIMVGHPLIVWREVKRKEVVILVLNFYLNLFKLIIWYTKLIPWI